MNKLTGGFYGFMPGACVQQTRRAVLEGAEICLLSTQTHRRHVVVHKSPVVRHVLPGVRQRLHGHSKLCQAERGGARWRSMSTLLTSTRCPL